MNFLRAASSATVRWVWQHQIWKTSGTGHQTEGCLTGQAQGDPAGILCMLETVLCPQVWALPLHHLPSPIGGLLQAVQPPLPGEDPTVSCRFLSWARLPGREAKGDSGKSLSLGHKLPTDTALGASPGGCHGTRFPTNTRCPKKCYGHVHPLGLAGCRKLHSHPHLWDMDPEATLFEKLSALPWISRFPRCMHPAALSSLSLV